MTKSYFSGKTILLTGGTGSFGRKFTEVALKEFEPETIRIYSRGEHRQAEMQREFKDDVKLRFFIGDVRDYERLYRAMHGVDIVVHAAALKSVPQIEYNPMEAIKTNIMGGVNVIEAAVENKVDRAVMISTDKAVYPVNLYGATKLVAEKLFVQGNSYSGTGGTKFSCVRYGNVMGSQGSVVPLFLEQRKTGTITITHPEMTRFWITLEQGVKFVARCIQEMNGGEVFVPKIPSARVVDIAEAAAPGAKVKIVGIRAGEKLNETLITEEEAMHTKEFADHFVVEPEFPFWDESRSKGGKTLPRGFIYTSKNNKWRLTRQELSKLIAGLESSGDLNGRSSKSP